MGADVGAYRGAVIEDEQASVIVGELELPRRAEHAAALDAANLADLDLEGGTALFHRRQLGTDEGAGHLDAGPHVGRAADDLEHSCSA